MGCTGLPDLERGRLEDLRKTVDFACRNTSLVD